MPQIVSKALLAALVLILAAPILIFPIFTPPCQAADAASIAVQSSDKFGDYIADGAGHPLYLFTIDKQGAGYATPSSSCAGQCATAWPPFTVAASPAAGDGAKAELIGTMKRADGGTQVTYNGWPLYLFINDKGKSDPQGQDVHGFGGEWYLVTPEGGKVQGQ